MISKGSAERLLAVLRLLVDEGHLTAQGKRQVEVVIEAERV